MKKEKILLIILLAIFIIALLSFLIKSFCSNNINQVLKDNGFTLKEKIPKGTTFENYTYTNDCDFYQTEDSNEFMYIYYFEDYNSVKKEMNKLYEEDKKGSIPVDFNEKNEYIIKKICFTDICSITLGYKNKIYHIYYPIIKSDKIEKLVNKLIIL